MPQNKIIVSTLLIELYIVFGLLSRCDEKARWIRAVWKCQLLIDQICIFTVQRGYVVKCLRVFSSTCKYFVIILLHMTTWSI